MATIVDPKDFLHALRGLDFPASRSQIVGAAKDTGGLNGNVLLILEQLPERTYETSKDLTAEIQRIYEPSSTNGDVQSAAATAVSDVNKELIAEMADPRRDDMPGETDGARGEDGQEQAKKILARNSELVDGTVEPSNEGAAEAGVGHMVNSDRSHVGDGAAND
jgi:hypothetical protein